MRLVLFVWLFALASGWANACLLQGRAADRNGLAAGAESIALVGSRAANAHADRAADHDDGGSARAACRNVCDDEQSTIPSYKLPAAPDLGSPPQVPAEPWRSVVAPATVPCGYPHGAAPPGEPPVAIRFLRLTI